MERRHLQRRRCQTAVNKNHSKTSAIKKRTNRIRNASMYPRRGTPGTNVICWSVDQANSAAIVMSTNQNGGFKCQFRGVSIIASNEKEISHGRVSWQTD